MKAKHFEHILRVKRFGDKRIYGLKLRISEPRLTLFFLKRLYSKIFLFNRESRDIMYNILEEEQTQIEYHPVTIV